MSITQITPVEQSLMVALHNTTEVLKQVVAERDALREALKNLLEDTQHAEHEDCEDGPCPVREARAALGEKS